MSSQPRCPSRCTAAGSGRTGREKSETRRGAGFRCSALRAKCSVLHVQLGTAVAGATLRIVRTVGVRVRSDRAALAVAVRADQAARIDAVADQVVVHDLGATLGQLL